VTDSAVEKDGRTQRPVGAPAPFLYADQDREVDAAQQQKPAGGFNAGHWYTEHGPHTTGAHKTACRTK
jgi:hypothetical protein